MNRLFPRTTLGDLKETALLAKDRSEIYACLYSLLSHELGLTSEEADVIIRKLKSNRMAADKEAREARKIQGEIDRQNPGGL